MEPTVSKFVVIYLTHNGMASNAAEAITAQVLFGLNEKIFYFLTKWEDAPTKKVNLRGMSCLFLDLP